MTVLILNSAQNKYPLGSDTWAQGTISAINSLAVRNDPILCSTDPSPWNLVTYLAGIRGMYIKLIVKAAGNEAGYREYERLRVEYALDERRTEPLFLGRETSNRPKETWKIRDSFAIRYADEIYPVSVKPGGHLDSLLSDSISGSKVNNDFRIEWNVSRYKIHYDLAFGEINPFPPETWLIHWSRASQGPWPGEKAWEFYRDLLARPSHYVRSAGETLTRIITEQKIRGSSLHLPQGETAVSLTSLNPDDSIQLMRWRKRFVQYSFEPFGLGIKRDILVSMGARRVRYEHSPSITNTGERLFFQTPGKNADWRKEHEWRFRGDLLLDKIERDDLVIIVPDETTGEQIRLKTGTDIAIHTLFKKRDS